MSPKTKAAIEKPTTTTRNLPILSLRVLIIAIYYNLVAKINFFITKYLHS